MITRADILRYDKQFINEGMGLPSRPINAGFAWLKEQNIDMDFHALDKLMEMTQAFYNEIYPGRDFSEYEIFIGGVHFRGEIYKASVKIVYGRSYVKPMDYVEITKTELKFIYQNFPDDFWEAQYSAADLWDFAYGVNDLRSQNQDANDSWTQARSQLAATYRTLDANNDLDSAIQSICMTAELSMKGVLYYKGISKSKIRKMSHNLDKLAQEVNKVAPGNNPGRLEMAVNSFPHYVQTRYRPSGLSKMELLKFSTQAQFIAGECLRRVSDRDMATQMENDCRNPPRLVA